MVRQGCTPIEADITDLMALTDELEALKPDVVVNCAAITDVDGCESSPVQAAEVNAAGVYVLHLAFPGKIVQVSTDYVFDGQAGPYYEDARPSPISVYGWSKLGGELALTNNRKNYLIVRTTMLFDRYPNNFVTQVIGWLKANGEAGMPDTLFGSPTYIPHLVAGILAAIQGDMVGIVNLAGNQVMSRFEFGQLIAGYWFDDFDLVKPGPVLGRAPRPRRAGLIVDKAISLGLPIGNPMDGLEAMHALEAMEVR